jgi:hypothetical protein
MNDDNQPLVRVRERTENDSSKPHVFHRVNKSIKIFPFDTAHDTKEGKINVLKKYFKV